MPYKDWEKAFAAQVAPGDPQEEARLWNLKHENRVNETRDSVEAQLGRLFDKGRGRGQAPGEAAREALDTAAEESKNPACRWLGQLPCKGQPAIEARTHLGSLELRKRYATGTALGPGRPMPTVNLLRPLKTQRAADGSWEPEKRFIWVSFDIAGQGPSKTDPTAVKRELGLAHFREGEFVYRFELPVQPGQARFVPTCFDAELYGAWAPPPPGFAEPYGMTRDLTDGSRRWPELVVETKDCLHVTSPTGVLVSPSGTPTAIGPVTVDYMAGRAP